MALLSFLNAGWFSLLFGSNPDPISIPIDLSQAGSVVEKEVKIEETWAYYLFLEFEVHDRDGGFDDKKVKKFLGFNSYDLHDGEKLRRGNYEQAKRNLGNLIDETYDCDGTIAPIKVTIYQINQDNTKKLIVDNLYMTKGYGEGAYTRDIAIIRLDKGKYIFHIENIEAFSEMIGRKVNFIIRIYKNKA